MIRFDNTAVNCGVGRTCHSVKIWFDMTSEPQSIITVSSDIRGRPRYNKHMTIQYAAVPTDPNSDSTPRSRQRSHPARRLPQIITRWRATVLLLILAGPLSLLLLSIVTYITPSNQYMRPCIPFSIHRISTAAHRTLSCQSLNLGKNNSSMSTSMNEADLAGSRLAGFLQSQKELFFGDLENGKGKGWTVAVGNEAGGTFPNQKSRSKLTFETSTAWYLPSHLHTSPRPLRRLEQYRCS